METKVERIPSLFAISLIHFFVALLLFIALLHSEHDLVVLSLLVLGLFGGAKLWAKTSLSGIKCHLETDRQRLFPGEEFSLDARAENRRFLPVWLGIEVPVDGSFLTTAPEAVPSRECGLLWKERASFQWRLTARRRGIHGIGPLLLQTGDLFGFFRRQRRLEQSLEIMVYPRLIPLRSFSLPRRDLFGVPGAKSPVQDPVYVLGTRDYQHGQPAKHIHWKASARYSRLQEKVFEPSGQEKLLLLLDVDPFARKKAGEEFEQAIEITASLAVSSERKGYAVGLLTNGNLAGGKPAIWSIGRGPASLTLLLETLARLQMESIRPLPDVLRHARDLPWGVSCVCFSYEQDETGLAVEEYCRYRRIPVVFILCRAPSTLSEESQKGRGKIYTLSGMGQEGAFQE